MHEVTDFEQSRVRLYQIEGAAVVEGLAGAGEPVFQLGRVVKDIQPIAVKLQQRSDLIADQPAKGFVVLSQMKDAVRNPQQICEGIVVNA